MYRPSTTTDSTRLFASGDFDAPGRTRFVERALEWLAPLAARLVAAGVTVEAAPLPAAATYAVALRRPGLGPRAALVLEVDEAGVEAALEIPAAAPEIELLRQQLGGELTAERTYEAIARLPEPMVLVLDGEPELAVHDLGRDALAAAVLRACDESRRLRIGFRVPRAVALAPHDGGVGLADQLEGALAALAVPFALLSPSGPALFRRALPSSRRALGPLAVRDSKRPIVVGSRVRIGSGPFEGQDGIVESLDGRGGARIRLGLLATRLDLTDLIAGARRPREAIVSKRPAFFSSHRRR